MSRAYYANTLLDWRDKLFKQRRQLMARYSIMERTNHPDKRDQGYLLEINLDAIENINNALRPLDLTAIRATDTAP